MPFGELRATRYWAALTPSLLKAKLDGEPLRVVGPDGGAGTLVPDGSTDVSLMLG